MGAPALFRQAQFQTLSEACQIRYPGVTSVLVLVPALILLARYDLLRLAGSSILPGAPAHQ